MALGLQIWHTDYEFHIHKIQIASKNVGISAYDRHIPTNLYGVFYQTTCVGARVIVCVFFSSSKLGNIIQDAKHLKNLFV